MSGLGASVEAFQPTRISGGAAYARGTAGLASMLLGGGTGLRLRCP